MGATTITYTTPVRRISRHLVSRSGTVTFTGTYATGGDTFAPVIGKDIKFINFEPSGGYVPSFDKTNSKLKMFFADYDAVADGPLTEAANATNLTAVTMRWSAIGSKG